MPRTCARRPAQSAREPQTASRRSRPRLRRFGVAVYCPSSAAAANEHSLKSPEGPGSRSGVVPGRVRGSGFSGLKLILLGRSRFGGNNPAPVRRHDAAPQRTTRREHGGSSRAGPRAGTPPPAPGGPRLGLMSTSFMSTCFMSTCFMSTFIRFRFQESAKCRSAAWRARAVTRRQAPAPLLRPGRRGVRPPSVGSGPRLGPRSHRPGGGPRGGGPLPPSLWEVEGGRPFIEPAARRHDGLVVSPSLPRGRPGARAPP